ncbi:Penicillin-binding protein 4 [Pleurostoma richardsiae]|uniref:Penicillin-binding protein 4 n=1 Tax=Pleurostoma richardsiae TaxID=41990 RepID=A0AA38RNA4_9PEZI|nr:Penicillin-binding protein 4 [Pleurostoma richardsiae]
MKASRLTVLAGMVSPGFMAQLALASEAQRPLGGTARDPFTKEFGKLAEELLEKWHVPGIAIGVVDGDETFAQGYGIATYPSTPVTPSTLFYGGSTTKAFTAAALGLMISSGNYTTLSYPSRPLDWTTPLADILRDDFVLQDDWATAHLTLEDALSHRTGMPRHDKALSRRYPTDDSGGGGDGSATRPATVRDVVRSLRHLPLNAEPRTTYQYCNLMYAVASHAAETLAGGRWLGDILREWIWRPLGMRSTYFSLDAALAAPEHLARGYWWDDGAGRYGAVRHMPLEEVSGAGSVISNVLDYAAWMRCLIDEAAPIPAEVHRAFRAPRVFPSEETGAFDTPPGYAFGWVTSSYKGHRLWTHSGGMDAFGAEVYFFPKERFGVVTFANTAVTSNAVGEILTWEIVDDKLGVPEEERGNWSAKWEGHLNQTDTKIKNAVDDLYPQRAKPGLPPALPIEAYVGTYFHPGYLNMTVELADAEARARKPQVQLVAERADFTWPVKCEFEHVSGEYWVMYIDLLHAPGLAMKEFAPAQFKIGANGEVTALGIEWRYIAEDMVEGLIWFDRIA